MKGHADQPRPEMGLAWQAHKTEITFQIMNADGPQSIVCDFP
jgi:hypothetical protein